MISNFDALIADPGYRHDCILTNLPFGEEQHNLHQRRRRAGKRRYHLHSSIFYSLASNNIHRMETDAKTISSQKKLTLSFLFVAPRE